MISDKIIIAGSPPCTTQEASDVAKAEETFTDPGMWRWSVSPETLPNLWVAQTSPTLTKKLRFEDVRYGSLAMLSRVTRANRVLGSYRGGGRGRGEYFKNRYGGGRGRGRGANQSGDNKVYDTNDQSNVTAAVRDWAELQRLLVRINGKQYGTSHHCFVYELHSLRTHYTTRKAADRL